MFFQRSHLYRMKFSGHSLFIEVDFRPEPAAGRFRYDAGQLAVGGGQRVFPGAGGAEENLRGHDGADAGNRSDQRFFRIICEAGGGDRLSVFFRRQTEVGYFSLGGRSDIEKTGERLTVTVDVA